MMHQEARWRSGPTHERYAELIKAPEKVQKISDCTAVACGAEFTMWLCDGKLWSAGGSQYGQLGHGTDHEYNAKDCKPHSLALPVLHNPAHSSAIQDIQASCKQIKPMWSTHCHHRAL